MNDYLDIDYNGRLPMIIFSEKGWETYKPVYVEELYNCILNVNIDESNQDDIVERLKGTNREVIKLYISFSSVASGHELSSSGSFNALAINFISFSTIFISI
ncbi:hypothetical protein [Clostridium sp. DMHC 10]|uniref:hypothetical protein n=1 Tax=Clostridium sp. DMHC 10 TaxID=747377 RepID=UPI00069EB432|nr:hypothetical protein [Clostridium sp. DMHC 10]